MTKHIICTYSKNDNSYLRIDHYDNSYSGFIKGDLKELKRSIKRYNETDNIFTYCLEIDLPSYVLNNALLDKIIISVNKRKYKL